MPGKPVAEEHDNFALAGAQSPQHVAFLVMAAQVFTSILVRRIPVVVGFPSTKFCFCTFLNAGWQEAGLLLFDGTDEGGQSRLGRAAESPARICPITGGRQSTSKPCLSVSRALLQLYPRSGLEAPGDLVEAHAPGL